MQLNESGNNFVTTNELYLASKKWIKIKATRSESPAWSLLPIKYVTESYIVTLGGHTRFLSFSGTHRMMTRHRSYRFIEGVLLRLTGVIALLLASRPKWGHGPDDFYLGYPYRFYITQSDVAYPYVSVPWFLLDVTLFGVPLFVTTIVILYGVRKLLRLEHDREQIAEQ
ncbi:hypothetical protein GCM10023156_60300 [Novipirellula rosea]|uniref:Uncharacterized protein n=1 Tax=Novipirellula rosea TaxID=1031540 RepID=A0ABP8NPV9_9BACT